MVLIKYVRLSKQGEVYLDSIKCRNDEDFELGTF